MNYWLMKSEPDVWSIDQQEKVGAKGSSMGWSKKLSSSKKLKSHEKRGSLFFLSFKYWKRNCRYC